MAKAFLASVALQLVQVMLLLSTAMPVYAILPVTGQGAAWGDLNPQQQQILAPLSKDWASISASRKNKWLSIADRYPTMSPSEQNHIQSQMRDWAQLTPAQRKLAREKYQHFKNQPPQKRHEIKQKWREYKDLPDEQKKNLQPAPAK